MRTLLLAVVALAGAAYATSETEAILMLLKNRKISDEAHALTGDALIDYINEHQHFWTAKKSKRYEGMSFEERKRHIAGVRGHISHIKDQARGHFVDHSAMNVDIPDAFDSRTQWPACKSIGKIRDQSACGSCWAFGAAEAISDRICIASNGATQVDISAADIMSCCGWSCGSGCEGGFPLSAWRFWVNYGVVSGANYIDKTGCWPYPFPECEHHTNATHYKPCPGPLYDTPKCAKKCQDGYSNAYSADKHYGKSAYAVKAKVSEIQKEILTNGPVEAAFDVYDDFEHYSGGVYVHTAGSYLGGHAVKILGWGSDDKGTPYWLVANSWNEDWGEKGYFRIIRGNNECGIEEAIVAGLPKV